MIAHKKKFYGGIGMLAAFVVVLIIVFSPVFKGQNGLEYLDSLYNSISKGSAYYIPKVKDESERFKGNSIAVTLVMADKDQAQQSFQKFDFIINEQDIKGIQIDYLPKPNDLN